MGLVTYWQADIADIKCIAKQNSGMRYLFIIIDVVFKIALVVPVYSNTAKAITTTFGQLLTAEN